MIRHLDIDDRNIDAARQVTDALGFLKQAPTGGIVISAANGSVTIDAKVMNTFVAFVRDVLDADLVEDTGPELSPQEAAERLRMSRPTVMRLISQGKLKARQVGSHYRLPEADVLKFKAEQAVVRRQSLDSLAGFSQEYDQ